MPDFPDLYTLRKDSDDWALYSPAGVRVKLYTATEYGDSGKAKDKATRECGRRNRVIMDRYRGKK